ncbi:MAG: hypothetical protein QXH08_05250 [Candidatus Hadarchaeales archaeon]
MVGLQVAHLYWPERPWAAMPWTNSADRDGVKTAADVTLENRVIVTDAMQSPPVRIQSACVVNGKKQPVIGRRGILIASPYRLPYGSQGFYSTVDRLLL